MVLDELPQVQKDIKDLSKFCVIGKILGKPIDLRTITSRTNAGWKFCKGDVRRLS